MQILWNGKTIWSTVVSQEWRQVKKGCLVANCYGHDDFVVSVLVLGHSIHKTTIALISENESKDTQNALQSVGWETLLLKKWIVAGWILNLVEIEIADFLVDL